MKVHLIKKQAILDFTDGHPAAYRSFIIWLTLLRHADWEKPEDIFRTYRAADLLGNRCNRVVFDIGGNQYRMICKYVFGQKQVHLFICWIGTHAEYDKICKAKKQYTLNNY